MMRRVLAGARFALVLFSWVLFSWVRFAIGRHTRALLAIGAAVLLMTACGSPDAPTQAGKQLVKYSYSGPPMTVITGVFPPWTTESRITGYFVVEELPPMTTTDFLDPDIEWPFPNLPETFAFSDGARTITRDNLENVVKDTGNRIDPSKYEVRAFWVTTDADGEIAAWDMLFVHDVRRSTFLTAHNGGIYGQEPDRGRRNPFRLCGNRKMHGERQLHQPGPGLAGHSKCRDLDEGNREPGGRGVVKSAREPGQKISLSGAGISVVIAISVVFALTSDRLRAALDQSQGDQDGRRGFAHGTVGDAVDARSRRRGDGRYDRAACIPIYCRECGQFAGCTVSFRPACFRRGLGSRPDHQSFARLTRADV